jgi:hypothetical protein
MKLARYNEYLFAIGGTLAAFLLFAGVADLALRRMTDPPAPEVAVIAGAGSDSAEGKAASTDGQRLAFCDVNTVYGSPIALVPVTVVNALDPDAAAAVYGLASQWTGPFGSGSDGYETPVCDRPRFNFIVWDTVTGKQRLLLPEPRPVDDPVTPDRDCGKLGGGIRCDRIIWKIRSADSNGDGRISSDDLQVMFVSDLTAEDLIQVSPPGTAVLDFGWLDRSGMLWIRSRRDANGDKTYDERDGSELLVTPFADPGIAQPIIEDGVRARLDGWIRPPDSGQSATKP